MKLIIGISGKAMHGKDSLARIIENKLRFGGKNIFTRYVNYADKIKDVVADMFYLDRRALDDLKYKETPLDIGITPRKILQVVGTDIARSLYKDVWVKNYERLVIDQFVNYSERDNVVIFTPDLRFRNEFDALGNFHNNGVVDLQVVRIRVFRIGFQGIDGCEHTSECDLDEIPDEDFDHVAEAIDLRELEYVGDKIAELIMEKF